MKGLRVTKIGQEIKFEGVWGKLQAKKCFQKQSFTNNFGETLVFMPNSAARKSLISFFQEFFVGIKNIFFLARELGARLSFCEVYTLSCYFLSRKSFDSSRGNSIIPWLKVMIGYCVTCGESKIW